VSYTQKDQTSHHLRGARHRVVTPLVAAAAALTLAGALAQSASASPALPGTSAVPAVSAVASPGRATVARWGAGYLARQISAHGGHLDSFGVTDVVDTAYAVLGLHAAGVGKAASDQAISFLKTQLGAPLENTDGSDNPGNLGYFILAAVSAGENPRRFGGTGPANDLVARLLATSRTSGPDAGLFGSTDPSYDGAFRQGLALSALKAAGVARSRPQVMAGVAWLTRQQCADGMWTSYRGDTTTACPAADLSTFAGPDTNSTGMAAQGLAAYGAWPRRAQLLASLHAVQSSDGGFPFLAAPGQPSDPDSTALAIQTILAEHGFPNSSRWLQGGASPYLALATYQLGCGDPVGQRGAFFYPGSRSPSTLASVQAVPALAGKTFPLTASTPSTAVPRMSCQAAAVPALTAGAVATRAGTAGHCPGTTGVTVAVDLTAFGKGVVVRCAPGTPTTGIAALKQAGFTVTGTATSGLGFVCRIQGSPTLAQDPCVNTPPPTAYWAYYHALARATTWTYATIGAISYKPPQGSIDAWAFGASARPKKTPAQVRVS
jgi:hypothetical protein